MPVTGLEAMADAGMHVEGWAPGSRSNLNRNPGNLRGSSLPHTMDAGAYCVFPDFATGYQALLADLWCKVTGRNPFKLGPDSTLEQLYDVYAPRADHNNPNAYAVAVAAWCQRALGRTITDQTKLRDVCRELFQEVK